MERINNVNPPYPRFLDLDPWTLDRQGPLPISGGVPTYSEPGLVTR